jgi:trehalose 6-phosphate synthase/phosphatase
MAKTIIISNRLPITIECNNNEYIIKTSIGGLATGLYDAFKKQNWLWVGWIGVSLEELACVNIDNLSRAILTESNYVGIFLNKKEINDFYYGFCNNTIWPLFHYFPSHAIYNENFWNCYKEVNEKYFKTIESILESDDKIWIHDYQLMLLPLLIRNRYPDIKIGFFLHIPFPSFEIFRLLPWRKEILEGLLGADLLGFHTYDYVVQFLICIRNILGIEHNMGNFIYNKRVIKADAFPMGIDYLKFSSSSQNKEVKEELKKIKNLLPSGKIILSIDRLDFTKGILQRLKAFSLFLKNNPDFKGKVSFILLIAPSRIEVKTYTVLKKEIDELVSNINSEFGTISWVPIRYLFRTFTFAELAAFYQISDVLIVTPLRDGMNLIAKEYIATRVDKKGIVILSETAGAAREMSESIIVNPNNIAEISEAIKISLTMSDKEKIQRNSALQNRIKRYDINKWIIDFIDKLDSLTHLQKKYFTPQFTKSEKELMENMFAKALSRLIILDYDGTLVSFYDKPEKAKPDEQIINILNSLSKIPNTEILIVSGRDKNELENWFSNLNINLIAGHGIWIKKASNVWNVTESLQTEWKASIRSVLEMFTDRTPGTFIEEKEFSLVWHYRKAEPELASVRLSEIKQALLGLTENLHVGILLGNKVLEVKNLAVNKGRAISIWLEKKNWDFILAIGDDYTDEDMFKALPSNAFSIKVGFDISLAKFSVDTITDVRNILLGLIEKANTLNA